MINLLFITANPKATALKDILQPKLKMKVDVVADFDHGLQDVFEKRPAAVVVQDHISGVAGESVARHIQMLLGKETPRFILLYEGDSTVRAVEGLFEYCVDLANSEQQLAEEIMSALESIFGEQWKNIVSPSKADSAALAASHEGRESADKMVDDLISDMEGSGTLPESVSSVPVDNERDGTSTPSSDEMAAMLIEAARQANVPAAEIASSPAIATAEEVKKTERKPRTRAAAIKVNPDKPEPEQLSTPSPEPLSRQDEPAAEIAAAKPQIPETPSTSPVAPHVAKPPAPANTPPPNQPASPADFRVSGKQTPVAEPIPEELLLAFEANYRSQSHSWRKMAVAAGVVCVAGAAGWFMFSPKPHTVKSSQKKAPVAATLPKAEQAKDKTALSPVAPSPIVPATPKPAAVSPPALPSFVSPKGKDSSYAATRPGWERYVDPAREVRIFRDNDRIKAVQVMAGKGKTLKSSFLETVLQELVGSSTYSLGSRERKQGYQGYLVQKGSVGTKAELIVYRKKTSDAIVAFVVSLD